MRLDDMERFVRAAEQREMDDDEDEEEQTGDDSGDDHILNICRQAACRYCAPYDPHAEHHGGIPMFVCGQYCCVLQHGSACSLTDCAMCR